MQRQIIENLYESFDKIFLFLQDLNQSNVEKKRQTVINIMDKYIDNRITFEKNICREDNSDLSDESESQVIEGVYKKIKKNNLKYNKSNKFDDENDYNSNNENSNENSFIEDDCEKKKSSKLYDETSFKGELFKIDYKNLEKEKIEKNFEKKFKTATILDWEENGDIISIIVEFKKRTLLYLGHRKLKIEKIDPINIHWNQQRYSKETREDIQLDLNEKESLINISCKNFSSNNHLIDCDDKNEKINYDIDYAFMKFFVEDDYSYGNQICSIIKEEINRDEIMFLNELILTIKIYNIFSQMKKKKEFENIEIISADYNMSEIVNNNIYRFKIDFLLKFKNKLFVFEMKFRSDRKNQEEEALRCIVYRKYVLRSLKFLREKCLKKFKEIKQIICFGVAINGDKYFNVGISMSKMNSKDINLKEIDEDDEFYKILKKPKRFKNLIKLDK